MKRKTLADAAITFLRAQGWQMSTAYAWEWANPDNHGSTWGTASRESWRSHSGSWEGAIRGTWAGNNNGGWWQEKPATPGVTYTFSLWVWADNTWTNQNAQGIKLEFLDGTTNGPGNTISAVTNSFTGIGESWAQKTLQGTAPTNAAWIRVVVYASDVGSAGALQFDDIDLVAEPGTVIILSQLTVLPVVAALLRTDSLEIE